jgi:nitrate reductase (cytochrome), electron transfer subunit
VRRSPFVLIGLAVVLMAAFVYVAASSLRAGQRDAVLLPVRAEPTPAIPFEAGVFRRKDRALDYEAMPVEPNAQRTLARYYARRAYPGAPPVIPHPVEDGQAGGRACLACHADGGFAPRFGAYAPVVPHPGLESCRQCHVPQATQSVFRATTWSTTAPPVRSPVARPRSSPPIPHGLEMGENCLACHGGPDAPAAIRTSHPTRGNCLQCHVPASTSGAVAATASSTTEPSGSGHTALLGSPPPIPHGLQMRENCLACHAGPGAVAELRSSHPTRVNCRQCHALGAEPVAAFARPGDAGAR